MKNLFFLSLFLLPHFVQAQSGMTLDECIRLAWKQNPSVRNSVIDIKEARADYMAAVGAFLPRAAVNAETGKRFGRSEKDLFDEFTQDENGNVVMSEEAAKAKIEKLGGYDKLYRIKLDLLVVSKPQKQDLRLPANRRSIWLL